MELSLPERSGQLTEISGPQSPLGFISAKVQNRLIDFYRSHPIYQLYDQRAVNYICGLATRFACWTLPEDLRGDEEIIEGYALWLSLIWMIDGIFDSYRSRTSPEVRDDLMTIINNTIDGWDIPFRSIDVIFDALYDITRLAYRRYLKLIDRYRLLNPEAFNETNHWLMEYFDTLLDEGAKYSLKAYADWRLKSGAMMCVVWQIIMFYPPQPQQDNNFSIHLYKVTSLIVSYYNDILSLQRDIKDNTPTLIETIREDGEDYWSAAKRALDLVNQLYSELKFNGDSFTAKICLAIVNGSLTWAHNEPRYADGVKMIQMIEMGDREQFDSLIYEKSKSCAGDPHLKDNW